MPRNKLAMSLTIIFCLAQLTIPWALAGTGEPVELEPTYVTTATKSEKRVEGVSASVTVITAVEIATMGAVNLKDIMKKTPGVIMQYGTFPAASSASKSSVSIRGLGANGTLFLVDGRRIANEVKNPYELERIPASIIERIEIIKGTMSVLYGADAVGGIINIITKKPTEELTAGIGIRGGISEDGDAENANADFSLQGKWRKLGYTFYANALSTRPYDEKEHSNSYIKMGAGKVKPSQHPNPMLRQMADHYEVDVSYREDSEVFTVGSRLEYELASWAKIGAEVNYFDEEREGKYISAIFPTNISPTPGKKIPAFDIPVRSTDDNQRLDLGLDLRLQPLDSLMLNFRIYNTDYRKRNDTTALDWQHMGYASEDDSVAAAMAMNADVDITSYEGYLVYMLPFNHLLTFGGEYRDEERTSSVFNPQGIPETRDVDYTAVYLQDEWQITDTLSTNFGVRYDDISNADSETTFKVGFVNRFSPLFNLRINYAQGYRTPDIRELYISKITPMGRQLGATVAEPMTGKMALDLEPEFVDSYEIGLSGERGGFYYSVALFYNDIEDKIDKVLHPNPNPGLVYYAFENVSDAETMGLELTTNYRFSNGLELSLNWYELDTENKKTGKDLEFNPEREIVLAADYLINEQLALGLSTRYTGEQYYSESVGKQKISKTTDDYIICDLTVSYKFGQDNAYEIYGGIDNFLDEDVDKILGSNVGRYAYLGARAKF